MGSLKVSGEVHWVSSPSQRPVSSCSNAQRLTSALIVLPGALGLWVLPAQGAYRGVRSRFRSPAVNVLSASRRDCSRYEASKLSSEERSRILAVFVELEGSTKKRKKSHKAQSRRLWRGNIAKSASESREGRA
jgi:hypothetical protein